MSDAMHPTGRCECGGEGRCAWCLMNQWRQRATEADAGWAEESAQVEHRCHQIEKIAMALGLDLEWSNLCDIGDEALPAAKGLAQRVERLRAVARAAKVSMQSPALDALEPGDLEVTDG